MSTPTYKVISETVQQVQCDVCGGVGHTIRTFQREKYKSTCYMCGGNGTRKTTKRTEVTLTEALEKLGLINNQQPVTSNQ